MQRLVAVTGTDGDLVTALRATAAQHGGARLGLHAGKEAVGLGPVAAIGLKGTLRHEKNPCGRRVLPLKLLVIAAISEYTRRDGFFTAKWFALAPPSTVCPPQSSQDCRFRFGRARS